MPFIADFHIHSKYSRATSKDMDLENLAKWSRIKGISMMGTGDFTHPEWYKELKLGLEEVGRGVYRHGGTEFILTAEVSNIYFKAGKTRRVHNIIFAPGIGVVKELQSALSEYGDLAVDGRPILDLDCERMLKIFFAIDSSILCVPAHAWTPHFSLFGSNFGFDSPEECFGSETDKVLSIETGLSSDPAMNWRWSKLDRFCITSNSDAHSLPKIGREANVFNDRFDYPELVEILRSKDAKRLLYTIEFFPEEGKYHWDGHRQCKTRLSPKESIGLGNICPVCGKKVTVGVAHRLEKLADRSEGFTPKNRPAFKSLVPLQEIIADAFDMGTNSLTVGREYARLIKNFGNEFHILLTMSEEEIMAEIPRKIAEGIINVRKGKVDIKPGYDGEYGTIDIFKSTEEKQKTFF